MQHGDSTNRWKQSKDLNDSNGTGRARTMTPKQDQQIVLLAENNRHSLQTDTSRVKINERTVRRRDN